MNKKKNTLMIINPAAGQSDVKPSLGEILEYFSHNGLETTVIFTEIDRNAEAIVKECGKNRDLIVCCGGDGTLNEVASGMIRRGLTMPLGYIPTGTTNDMAQNLGLPDGFLDAAKEIVEGMAIERDLGVFNESTYFTYIASFGAFTESSYETPQWSKNLFGHSAYVIDGIRRVGTLKAYSLRAVIDGTEIIEGDFVFGSVSNSISVGGFLKFDKNIVKFDDGGMELLLIRFPKSAIEWTTILDGLIRRDFDNELIYYITASSVNLHFENEVAWTLDGEYGGDHRDVDIGVLPKAYRIVH